MSTIADVKKNADQKMQKSLEALKADLGKVRTGRAHPGVTTAYTSSRRSAARLTTGESDSYAR